MIIINKSYNSVAGPEINYMGGAEGRYGGGWDEKFIPVLLFFCY